MGPVPISIATLNIAAASRDRARRILEEWVALAVHDIHVFTETSQGEGTRELLGEFRAAGWTVFTMPLTEGDRGVAIATCIAASAVHDYPDADPAPGRAVIVDLETVPSIRLIGMYVPNRGNNPNKVARKRGYMTRWLDFLGDNPSDRPRILLGDLNIVPPGQRPKFLPQSGFEYEWYEQLLRDLHLVDAATCGDAGGHESTWVAHSGEGYTYDYALIDERLRSRLANFAYAHETRAPHGISDHSALSFNVCCDELRVTAERMFSIPTQGALF